MGGTPERRGDRGGRRAGPPAGQLLRSPRPARPSSYSTTTPSAWRRWTARSPRRTAAPPSPVTRSTCWTWIPPATGHCAPRRSSAGRRAGPPVGGWRGSETFTKTSLDDWDFLELLLIRTVQHSLAFFEALQRSDRGRYLLISAVKASAPPRQQRRTPPPRPPPRRGRSPWPTTSARPGSEELTSAAAILVVKALVHDAMRADRPNAKFAGFTDVKDLAEAVVGVWDKFAAEVNGNRLWLTEKP